jgi:hypothetical protein
MDSNIYIMITAFSAFFINISTKILKVLTLSYYELVISHKTELQFVLI